MLVSATVAARIADDALRDAQAALAPLVLSFRTSSRGTSVPDLAARLRKQLGLGRMKVDGQAQALLDLVEADRKEKCDAILADAKAAARRSCARPTRTRGRGCARPSRRSGCAATRAPRRRTRTCRRDDGSRNSSAPRALLAAGWERLPGELVRRWRMPDLRRAWIAIVVAEACKSLPGRSWRVAHAPDWPVREWTAGNAEFAEAPAAECAFDADARIGAGMKISAGGCIVDGTLDGLLSDRAEIGSRLLQLLNEDTSA